MRRLHTFCRYGIFFVGAALLGACSGTPTYNPTVFPASIDQARLDAHPMKTVVIAHVNLGSQSRNYLRKRGPTYRRAGNRVSQRKWFYCPAAARV